MKNLRENIKNYFAKNQPTQEAPIGMCPICWGHSEWDGEYNEKKEYFNANGEIYNTFINKIVDKHISITKTQDNKSTCTACDKAL